MSKRIEITEWPKPNPKRYFYPFLLLAVHKLGGSAKGKEVCNEVIGFFDFEESLLKETFDTGKNKLKAYINLALAELKIAGYFADEKDLYRLSNKGKNRIPELMPQDKTKSEELTKLIEKEYLQIEKERKKSKETVETEKEEEGEEQYRNDLEIIQKMNAFSFERLCALLFKKVEYEDVQTTQKSGDGGYDGFGYLVFGLIRFKVAFQAKKYKKDSKIGPGEIQAFSGTMKQVGAEKGVFITTSDFSQKAKESGVKLGIDLINGEKLIDLLQKHQIGYSQKVEIDKKFFEEL